MLDHKSIIRPCLFTYHTDYSKNIVLKLKIQEYTTQIQQFKKEIYSLKTTVQELWKKFSSEKNKDDPNVVHFYTGFENYDALIAVFKCLEPKVNRTCFWQGADKCKDETLKYQSGNINKPGRKAGLKAVFFYPI